MLLSSLLILNILLQIADAALTRKVIKRGGHETNPLLIWLAVKLMDITKARWAWLSIKTLIVAPVIAACWFYKVPEGLLLLAGWYGAIVFMNYLHYRRQG